MLDFFEIVANLKNTPRQGWIDRLSISNPESVADHTYSMALMGMVVSDLENYDSEKILKMILLHDLAESHTEDITPNRMSKENKNILEQKAMKKILKKLPNSVKTEYDRIWIEYQENTTQEALFVHQIDKLEMALQARVYQKSGKTKKNINSFLESAKKEITHPKLRDLFNQIIKDVR